MTNIDTVAFSDPLPSRTENMMAKASPNRAKAETLSLRISPRTKFGLEVIARVQERSLTTIVESALGQFFDTTEIDAGYLGLTKSKQDIQISEGICFSELVFLAYSIDGPTRLIRTAIVVPMALSSRDEVILHLIKESGAFSGPDKRPFPSVDHMNYLIDQMCENYFQKGDGIDIDKVRRNWSILNEAADYSIENGVFPDKLSWI